jgi:GntR family transcriptional regulator
LHARQPKLPAHQQIARTLRQRISSGYYDNGELPPELSLVQEFEVSRHTVRSALQHLVNDGLIDRRAGRGTTITKRATGGSWLIGSLEELLREIPTEEMRTLEAKPVPAKDVPQAAAMFGVSPSGKVFHIKRLLLSKRRPFALVDMYTSTAYASRVPRDLLDKRLLVMLIEEYCAVRAARVRQMVSAASTTKRQAKYLGCQVGDPILLLTRTYRTSHGDAILHMSGAFDPSLYQHIVEFVHEGYGPAEDDDSPADRTSRAALKHAERRAPGRA